MLRKTLRFIRKLIVKTVIFFIVSTVLAVVFYKFFPVYVTPLMVIRCCEQVANGESIRWHHTWVPLSEMSPSMPVAVMGSEDARFLQHHGFDYDAIEKAMEHNRTHENKHGASTISQQTAKNVFLWPQRSWLRKGLETYFTVLIELLWSKQRIMEVYLNSIETGDGIYGVEAVSRKNFDMPSKRLSRSECALIAATLPNPRKFDSAHPSRYIQKRRWQIERNIHLLPEFPK